MPKSWYRFFSSKGNEFLRQNIKLALLEDGPEMTSQGIFSENSHIRAQLKAKEKTIVAGLPVIGIVFKMLEAPFAWKAFAKEGDCAEPGCIVAEITAPAIQLLKAERVILNYITHLSGIASLAAEYAKKLEGTGVRLLDTRKTLPGLRWPEKYAVQLAGGANHRMDLTEMLMLKDNHIDAAGSIVNAVKMLRNHWQPCPPIEVECRTIKDVKEALEAGAERIMLDNMQGADLANALMLIPKEVEAEVSGGVTLDNIRNLAALSSRRPDFISVGRLTHSAPAADFSMMIIKS